MKSAIKITIIIPVYNVEKYLPQCLDSVIGQTLQEIEIICVNDGSTDGSLKILNEYAGKDKRIIVIDNKESKGSAFARNQMLEIACGEYVGFVDSDDFIDLNFYNVLYTAAKSQNADLARTTYYSHYSDNLKEPNSLNGILKVRVCAGQDLNMNDHSVVIWNAIYRRDFLYRNNIYFDASHKYCNDIIFVAKTTFYSSKSIPVLGTFYHYRRFFGNERSQHLSYCGKVDIDNFIKVQISCVNFLNSVNFDDKNDYITAYKRFLWRFDIRFNEMARAVAPEELKKLFNASVLAFNLFKYKDELKNESYYEYLVCHKFKDYLHRRQNPELIISLTSSQERISSVNQVIDKLLKQTKKADKVILWLSIMQFPNKEADLPLELLALTDRGLTISYIDSDIKYYAKLIPALEEYPNSIIVTVEDSILYPLDLIEKLYTVHMHNPNIILGARKHRVIFQNEQVILYHECKEQIFDNSKPSYLNIPFGAVLYPPKVLHKDITKRDLFMKLLPLADGIWFWTMAVKQGIKIFFVQEISFEHNSLEGIQNIDSIQVASVLKHYPDVFKKIKKESARDVKDEKEKTKIDIHNFFGKMRRRLRNAVFGR